MNCLFVLALTAGLLFPNLAKADTNHFGAGGVFELDLGDSEIPMKPKEERERNLLEENLKSLKKSLNYQLKS